VFVVADVLGHPLLDAGLDDLLGDRFLSSPPARLIFDLRQP